MRTCDLIPLTAAPAEGLAFRPDEVLEMLCAPQAAEAANRDPARAERLACLRRERVTRPTIYVGVATCGVAAGAGQTLRAIEAHIADRGVDAESCAVGCLGLCSSEPVVGVQLPGRPRVEFERVTADLVGPLLDRVLAGELPDAGVIGQHRAKGLEPWAGVPFIDEHPYFRHQTRRVLADCGLVDPTSIDAYLARGGYRGLATALLQLTRTELCEAVETSGLRSAGHNQELTGIRWRSVLGTAGDRRYLICNADERDPGAFRNAALLESDPHRVVEAIGIAAYAIGAERAYLCIRGDCELAIQRVSEAIRQAAAYHLLGENVLGSGASLRITLSKTAGAFVCGEETALISALEGRRGTPRPEPPPVSVSGLFGEPTAVEDVELLANLPTLLARGGEWFATAGTPTNPGTKVLALSGKVTRCGRIEVPMGTTIRQIVFDIGGGPADGREFKAVQIGGPCGQCLPASQLDLALDHTSLEAIGTTMGSGSVLVMDQDTCMVDVAKYFMEFAQRESCGKCIPCREGTRHMAEILAAITRPREQETGDVALQRFKGVIYLSRLAEVIQDASLCRLGRSAPNPVLSTLRWFRDEYEAHVFERRCPAGVCRELLDFRIDTASCNGCGQCAAQCPAGAIMGAPGSPHYIVGDTCVGCGACVSACPNGAISANQAGKRSVATC